MDLNPAGSRTRLLAIAAPIASALLLAVYARGDAAWVLGFVALLPWLLALDAQRDLGGALRQGLLMAVAFVAAVFPWFAAAVDAYAGLGFLPAMLLLCLGAPLLQPQVVVFALARHLGRRHSGPAIGAIAGAAAWVGCEWSVPKLLGDTLGHGLLPSATLRQVADLGGAAGLTVLLILVAELLAHALRARGRGARAVIGPLALAAAVVAAMAAYGHWRSGALREALGTPTATVRIAMVQSGLVDYERRRQAQGTYGVVREVLDTHFALSLSALEQHGAEVLLWSETVYPTPFGHPRSADGAALDREILDFVQRVQVPLVFGTYDVDAAGEYNAAAFLDPTQGLIGYYRKTHPFPLTEHVPAWLDGPVLRRLLPWAGTWRPGDGVRVMPLRTVDGRQLDVVPLICLDDVHPDLALEGARLGAQAIVGLSNDAWFSEHPIGARLHLAVAAFRSIETRLPQLRTTSNGITAFVDPGGEVLARTMMGDRAVLAGEVPIQAPPMTLMVRWGDWVGRAGLCVLLVLAIGLSVRARRTAQPATPIADAGLQPTAVLLSPRLRALCAALRVASAAGLAVIALRMVLRDGLQVNSLDLVLIHAGGVLAPALAAWLLAAWHTVRIELAPGLLRLCGRHERIEIPLDRIAALRVWRWPLPRTGVDLRLASGRRFEAGLAIPDPSAFLAALVAAGAPARFDDPASIARAAWAAARRAARWPRLDHPLVKFVLFPLLPALPAFHLHQQIAFGGPFGEWQTYGAGAWLVALLIWWAAWSIGVMLFAAVLRLVVEAIVAVRAATGRAQAASRRVLESCARALVYLGVPAALAIRLLAG